MNRAVSVAGLAAQHLAASLAGADLVTGLGLTRDKVRTRLTRLKLIAAEAHRTKNYSTRNRACAQHDRLALILHRLETD